MSLLRRCLAPVLRRSYFRYLSTTQSLSKDMAFTFSSPVEVFYDTVNVRQIDVPGLSGDFGILPGHVPLLGVLKPGVVTVHDEDGNQNKYFVSSGSVTVNEDSSVQILAEEAAPLNKFDTQAVNEGLAKSQQELTSASTDESRARAQIAVDCYDSLHKALGKH